MKATGIVRRIDDLGRVVIPKEIRRTMRIREGDPLEIYTTHEGEVIFKKYSIMNELGQNAAQVADIIQRLAECPVAVFDRDHVIAVSGVPKKEYIERRISLEAEELMENRKMFFSENNDSKLDVIEGMVKKAIGCVPVLSNGDVTGAVAFLENGEAKIRDLQKSLIIAAAQFLGKQTED